MFSILGALLILLAYIIKIGVIIGVILLLTYVPTYIRVLWVKLLTYRNVLIIRYVMKKRIKYIREKRGTDDPLAWKYESSLIYNTYRELLPIIIDNGGGNCPQCHTLTLPNMLCPKCGNWNTSDILQYYHKDVKDYLNFKKRMSMTTVQKLRALIKKETSM